MTIYILDTNIISFLLDKRLPQHYPVQAHFDALSDDTDVRLSVSSFTEYLYYSNNPPAKPGAFVSEPLKAAESGR